MNLNPASALPVQEKLKEVYAWVACRKAVSTHIKVAPNSASRRRRLEQPNEEGKQEAIKRATSEKQACVLACLGFYSAILSTRFRTGYGCPTMCAPSISTLSKRGQAPMCSRSTAHSARRERGLERTLGIVFKGCGFRVQGFL